MITKLNLVFIIISLDTGGAQSILIRLLRLINRDKFNITVISLTDKGELGAMVEELGFPLITIGMSRNIFNIFALIRLYKVVRELNPDVVHTWMYHSDFFGGLTAKLLDIKLIIWGIRSADFFSSETPKSTKLIVRACAWLSNLVPNVIVYNSQKGLNFHNNLGYAPYKSMVIYNGVDINRFKPNKNSRSLLRNKLHIRNDKKIIGLIARYDGLKNHEGFIKMAAYINEVEKDCDFLMVGNNIKGNEVLLSLVDDLNLNNNFHLVESVTDIEKVISGLDAIVITSVSEAFPNVLIESMACGVPCFSTNVGDVKYVIQNQDWIVPVGDMRQLAGLCLNYLNLDNFSQSIIKKNIRLRACEKFDSTLMVQNYESIYLGKQ